MTFYLIPLEDVKNDPFKYLALSESTLVLCLKALISAEYRSNWRYDLDELTDLEWAAAEDFLTMAIDELTAPSGVIDGGNAAG
ncbi:MAG: hypothetical protein ACE5FZ_06645 [Nitrospiria bacterium]